MTLRDLRATFVQIDSRDGGGCGGQHEFHRQVEDLSAAQGLELLCPKCAEHGIAASHKVFVTFADRGVPDELGNHAIGGAPLRWMPSGTSLDDLTLDVPIDLTPSCGWVGTITGGIVS